MQASSMSEVDANTARARFFLDYLTKKTDDTAAKETASLCFDTLVLQDVTSATSTGPGNCSCELKITPRVSNSHGTLHGGCTGNLSIVQCCVPLLASSQPEDARLDIESALDNSPDRILAETIQLFCSGVTPMA